MKIIEHNDLRFGCFLWSSEGETGIDGLYGELDASNWDIPSRVYEKLGDVVNDTFEGIVLLGWFDPYILSTTHWWNDERNDRTWWMGEDEEWFLLTYTKEGGKWHEIISVK